MQLKRKIYLVVALSFFSLCLVSTVPVTAFSADSYSQNAGNVFIWEITTSKPLPSLGHMVMSEEWSVWDQMKLEITVTNKTLISSKLYNIIWGSTYRPLITIYKLIKHGNL